MPNPPDIKNVSFDCPHCGAFAAQSWQRVFVSPIGAAVLPDQTSVTLIALGMEGRLGIVAKRMVSREMPFIANAETVKTHALHNCHVSICHACQSPAVWFSKKLVFPQNGMQVLPNQDMPADIAQDFKEAALILHASPRGACALLRLCVQKLCKALGESGTDINADIGKLVAKGLNPTIQQALDVVRVIGNESVHPGSLDLKDDTKTASALMAIVNIITEQLISQPKMIGDLFSALPEKKREGIQQRDRPKS